VLADILVCVAPDKDALFVSKHIRLRTSDGEKFTAYSGYVKQTARGAMTQHHNLIMRVDELMQPGL
jgi:hypothetical protein